MKKRMVMTVLCLLSFIVWLEAAKGRNGLVRVAGFAVEEEQSAATETAKEADNGNGSSIVQEEGAAGDIRISKVSIDRGKEGENVRVSFTVTGGQNAKKNYEVDSITQVYPVVDAEFPFETDDTAYRVTTGNGNTLQCDYTFKVKKNIDTQYYPLNFVIVYGRKSTTAGGLNADDKEYALTKSFNISLTAKQTTQAPATTETVEELQDINMIVEKTPEGTYGSSCEVHFVVKSSSCKITGIMPVIDETFPFETKGDAYKTITSKGSNKVSCDYDYKVRSDVATGYQPVMFQITYVKDKTTLTVTRSVNVKLTGKKEKKEDTNSGRKTRKPRVRIASYELDKSKIIPGKTFHLQLKIKNYAKTEVSNVMFTVESENGEFLPVDGTGSVYQDTIAAGKSVEISFALKPANQLEENSYKLVLKTEYENSQATEYAVEENIYIPIQLSQRLSVTDVFLPETGAALGDTVEISAVVNNLGGGTLYNVTASVEENYLKHASTYIGNIESGKSGSIDLLAKAGAITPGGTGKNKMIISYEDKEGNLYEQEELIDVSVNEPVYKDLEKVKEGNDYKGVIGMVVRIVAGIVIVAMAIIFWLRRKKRKREMLEEWI